MSKPSRVLFFMLLLSLLPVGPLRAQDEDALRAELVGQEVVVRIDMPATKDGIDLYPERDPRIEFDEYYDRLSEYGISIGEGSTARITDIVVKGKHIEFHLDGGGYGTFGDESEPSTHVARPPKSRRQEQLEEDLRDEADPDERRRIQRDIDREEEYRDREHRRLQDEARERAREARARIARARLLKGSRFNVRYDRDVPVQIRTPGGLMAVLSEYVQPVAEADTRVAFPDGGSKLDPQPAGAAGSLLPIRKGMSEEEVTAVFGIPTSRQETTEGSLPVLVCTYRTDEVDVEATFVSGALVRYSIVSR